MAAPRQQAQVDQVGDTWPLPECQSTEFQTGKMSELHVGSVSLQHVVPY